MGKPMTDEETARSLTAVKEFERLADIAAERMYAADYYAAKDFKDDACSYLYRGIEAAKRAGLEKEAARLTARRNHMTTVWSHQFRGVGRLDTSVPGPPRRQASPIRDFFPRLWRMVSAAFH
jgi:hypothetical protein